ncbi:MAG: glyceraldehyde 3-phosphate dehydrogenase NAD-binding domain-containing protein [Acidobacteriota bacterium]
MSLAFAINGFGRIGRSLARVARERPELELVAVNDIAPLDALAHLLRFDSVHGRLDQTIDIEADLARSTLRFDGHDVVFSREADPARVPWPADVQVVVEATGVLRSRAEASAHLRPGGPCMVLVSALADEADAVICQGVAPVREVVDPARHHMVSNASCTTHCVALLLHVLDECFGVRHALMDETHSYTAAQNLVDGPHERDPRRGRAAGVNIVPTYSEAPAAAAALVGLEGRVAGRAVRVPTADVALLDLVVHLDVDAAVRDSGRLRTVVADAFRAAAAGPLDGLLGVVDEPVVSSDLIGDSRSAVVDLGLLQTVGDLVRVSAWYDNEWGYAHRLADTLITLGDLLS